MDILQMIYEAIIGDEVIGSQAGGKIKYYEFPEPTVITDEPQIIIEPIDVPTPSDFADNQYLMYDVLLQVETWSKSRARTKETANRIEFILWELGFVQNGGLDEYDEGVFRDARRYRGKIYRNEIINL